MRINTRHRLTRAGGTAALVAGLFAGGYGIASAATGTSGTSGSTSSGSATQAPAGMPMGAMGRHGGPGGPGGPRGLSGTVSNLASGSFTLTRPDGSTVTVDTTGTTTYNRDGASADATALANGERVSVRPNQPPAAPSSGTAPTAPTTVTASAVDIMDPSIRGTVQSVNGNVVIVVDDQGFSRTINLSGATTYTNAGSAATQSAVTPGAKLVAFGSVDANGTSLDATKVAVNPTHPQHADGPMGAPPAAGSASGSASGSGASA